MMTITQALRAAAIDRLDARVLMCAALRVSDVFLVAHGDDALGAADHARFLALVARRVAGEPVAYITGEREFFSRAFRVTPAVLIPRPETELLVELALERLPVTAKTRVLDLGTGSGCIAISIGLARGAAHVVAIDQSAEALEVARHNARRLGAGNITFANGNWYAAVHGETFDLIAANPPYVAQGDAHLAQGDLRFEPLEALSAGNHGLAAIQAIVRSTRAHLSPGGWLLLEHGHDQAAACRELLQRAGFAGVQSWRDLSGIERVCGAHSL